jgi:hypothetical protein
MGGPNDKDSIDVGDDPRMSTETREYCDCCRRDLTYVKGVMIYRKRVRSVFHWLGREEDPEWNTLCGDCWNTIGREVEKARASSSEGNGS